MTYLVLARKWRPRSFDTLVGQDHVVRALTHALDTQRLHHAWLFTGTRGVGKTTLSRILAKSLNCETGITSKPCGVCQACTEIDSGRFVDYLELDAASNRGVDEMTQLLEQAVYAPGAGRFKVYMIDEVHMLTGHAFNAMLKTLEEPPPHVKFILATTDPQKIPVTVLSRCLQFNLKQMPPDAIVGHLRQVLGEEQLAFEVPALRLIAQAAAGSMRDSLSLTDQAIAYSAGNLTEEAVRGMLGTIDQRHLVRLLDALGAGDARAVLAVADELATRGLSYSGALADFAGLLSRVAIEQRVTGAMPADDPLAADITRLARSLHPDAVQLFYSVAVHSRGELALAPDEYAGFVMACLRMLSLSGSAGPQAMPAIPPATNTTEPAAASATAAKAATAATAATADVADPAASSTSAAASTPGAATLVASVPKASMPAAASPATSIPIASAVAAATPAASTPAASSVATPTPTASTTTASSITAAMPGTATPSASAPAVTTPAASSATASTAISSAPTAASTSAGIAPWDDAPSAPSSVAPGPGPAHAAERVTPVAVPASVIDSTVASPDSGSGADSGAATAAPAVAANGFAKDAAAVASGDVAQDAAVVISGDVANDAVAGDAAGGASGDAAGVHTAHPATVGSMAAPVTPAPSATGSPAPAAPVAAPVASSPASDDNAPPAWVDEVIPDDAEGGYQPSGGDDDGFIASPDEDDFETMAGGGRPQAAPAAAPVRRAPASGGKARRGPRLADMSAATWPELAARLPVTGLAAELARQSEWHGVQGDAVILRVAVRTLADSASRVRLQTVLCEHFGQSLRLDVLVGATGEATAHAVAQQVRAERQRAAEAAVEADPFVRSLLSDFGGQVVPGSIRHVDPQPAAPR